MQPDSDTPQLMASILLGSLALIPNDALRYTALAVITSLLLTYTIYLRHPSTRLQQLKKSMEKTEEIIQSAKLHCPRDYLSLAEEGAHLLECV
jgi:hypothetical protein